MFVHWFLFPLLVGFTLLGLGLGVRRLSTPFPAALVLPLGLSAAVTVAAFVAWSGATAALTGPALIVLAALGWAGSVGVVKQAVGDGFLRREAPWIAAVLVAFVVSGLAVLVSGHPTYSGYDQIDGLARQLGLAAQLGAHGRDAAAGGAMVPAGVRDLLAVGQPSGPFAVLGGLARTVGLQVTWAWEPFSAVVAGTVVSAAYAVVRLATARRGFAALAAFVVAQAVPLSGGAPAGGAKELAVVAALLAAIALIPTFVAEGEDASPRRAAVPFALAFAGAYSVLAFPILPVLIVVSGASGVVARRTGSAGAAGPRSALPFAAFFVVATIPTTWVALSVSTVDGVSPFGGFDALAVLVPVGVALLGAALALLATSRSGSLAPVAWAGLVVLALGGLYADTLRYGSAQLAPYERLTALHDLASSPELAGARATLMPDRDEDGQLQLREVGATQAPDGPFVLADGSVVGRDPATARRYAFDLDELSPDYINRFDLVVLRRSPGQSRPGRQFERVRQDRFVEVWRRTSAPATALHTPLSNGVAADDPGKCEAIRTSQPEGKTFTIAPAVPFDASATATFDQAGVSDGWQVAGTGSSVVYTRGRAGEARGSVDVGEKPGPYDVFASSVGLRPATVMVNGAALDVPVDPAAATRLRRPQYLGTVTARAGANDVLVRVGGASLRPGTRGSANDAGGIGGLRLVAKDELHPPLLAGVASTLTCPDPVDWVETP